MDGLAEGFRVGHAQCATSGRALRGDDPAKAELAAFLEAAVRLCRLAKPARQTDLAEGGGAGVDGEAAGGGGDRERDGQVSPRLVDPHAAGDVHEDVGLAERDACVPREHGDDHREPLRVDAGRDAPRHREVCLRDERLHLEQDRPRALERARDGGARLAVDRAAEDLRRVGHADEPGPGHLEDAELVRRAEPVLHTAEDPVRAVAVPLELEHAVDEMLEHARTGHGAVLRHVADEDRRDPVLLRDAQQPAGRLAHLGDRPGRRAELGRVERLHRVDHADLGPLALERLADRVELGLREDLDVRRSAEPLRAELHLRDRLLARDEQRATVAAHRLQGGEEQRRLADARLAADEHERGRHEPAAEHAVELRDAGRDPLRLLDLDVDEPQQRLRRRLGRAHLAEHLLDERPERVAARALAEPAPGRVAALRARELNRRLRHDIQPMDGAGRIRHRSRTSLKRRRARFIRARQDHDRTPKLTGGKAQRRTHSSRIPRSSCSPPRPIHSGAARPRPASQAHEQQSTAPDPARRAASSAKRCE